MLAISVFCTSDFALGEPVQDKASIYFSQSDKNNYQRAYGFAQRGDEIALNATLPLIADKTLIPDLQFELYIKSRNPDKNNIKAWLTENANNANADLLYDFAKKAFPNDEFAKPNSQTSRRSFARIRAPRENPNAAMASASNVEKQAYAQIKSQFNANADYAVIEIAAANLASSNGGAFAWYGGLSAYRIGEFEKALEFFRIASNYNGFDESKKSAANYWAARTASKLKLASIETSMLEQVALNPLSFYGQLAIQKLGRWQNLAIPEQKSETQSARDILANSLNARRALALFDLGRFKDAQNELAIAWNNAPSTQDLGFLFIAQSLGFNDLAQRISEMSNNAFIAGNFPIAEYLTPQGGSFVSDRALIYAIMRQESRFKTNAVSHAGARGLMQLMPATAAWMANRSELKYNPDLLHNDELNITLGEAYLERIMKMRQIDNSLARTLMAYNAGPGAVSRWANAIEMSDDTLMFIEATPVTETREYVKKVMSNLWIYHKRLGQSAPSLARLALDGSPDYEPQDNPRLNAQNNLTSLMR